MKYLAKTALIAISLLLSVGPGFAADVKVDAKAPVAVAKSATKSKVAAVKSPVKGKLVDINSATAAELQAVTGIGEVYAATIIAGRPYANKTQLKSRKILPGSLYEQIKDLIIANQIKK